MRLYEIHVSSENQHLQLLKSIIGTHDADTLISMSSHDTMYMMYCIQSANIMHQTLTATMWLYAHYISNDTITHFKA